MNLWVTPELARAFNSLSFDENAKVAFEYLSGSLCWSDEFPETAIRAEARDLWKHLLAHRASLILGKENPETARWWREMKGLFPNWPGFRPERCAGDLAERLQYAQGKMMAEFDFLDRVTRRAERIAKIRASRESKQPPE